MRERGERGEGWEVRGGEGVRERGERGVRDGR